MTQREPRDDSRKYDTSELFRQACEIAGLTAPSTPSQAGPFVERCLDGAKHKAELLAKAHVVEMTHSEALERVAALFGFGTWHDLCAAGKTFRSTGGRVGESDLRPLRLAACAWVLDESTASQLVAEKVLKAQREVLVQTDLDGVAEGLLERVMFRRTSTERKVRRSEADPWTVEMVGEILTEHMAWTPADLVMRLLEHVPVVHGRRAPFPALVGLTVGEVYDMPMAQVGHEAGFGYRGWSHLMALLSGSLETWAKVHTSHSIMSSDEEVKGERDEQLRQARSAATKLACKEYLEGVLQPVRRKGLMEVVFRRPKEDGFYEDELYSGCAEQVEADIRKIMHVHGDDRRFKRVCFREPHGTFSLSIFRLSRKAEESMAGSMVHEAEAVFHDSEDRLAARVGLCLSLMGEGASLQGLVWQLDTANESDLLEVGGAVVSAVEDGTIGDEEWRRLLVVRDWEVRKDLRGQRVGLDLLRAAVKGAFRGMPRPSCVAARLWPKQIDGNPFTDGAAIALPELATPIERLRRYWESQVVASKGVLPGVLSIDVSYMPFFHYALADFETFGLGSLLERARELDAE